MATECLSTEDFVTEFFSFDLATGKSSYFRGEKDDLVFDSAFYTEIPTINEFVMLSSVIFIGLALNAAILRFYWELKGDIAVYVRAFAIFDIFMILYQGCMRLAQLFLASNVILNLRIIQGLNVIVCFVMTGPLFLALDRVLIVAFPHKFKLYLTKMRICKCIWLTVSFCTGLNAVFSGTVKIVLIALTSVNLLLQLLTCIGLYTFIVVRVKRSQKRMKAHRNCGSKTYVGS